MNNYLLIHGSFGSPFVNWFPYLRNEIEKRNYVVYTPDFPTGVGYQNYNNWSKVLESYVSCGIINENTIIYAHSIAPIFVCHFLASHKIRVKRLVFVCGFNNYLGGRGVAMSKYIEDDEICFSSGLYMCTLCGLCTLNCPLSIPTNSLIENLRKLSTAKGFYPKAHGKIRDKIDKNNSPY